MPPRVCRLYSLTLVQVVLPHPFCVIALLSVTLHNSLPFPPTLSLPEVSSIVLKSPCNFITLSTRQVIRIKEIKTINKGIVFSMTPNSQEKLTKT